MTCSLMKGEPGSCLWCGGDLPGGRRKWCSDECERQRWETHIWSFARDAALRRDDWACVRCGSERSLEVNHITPRRGRGYTAGCHHHLDNLETLCHWCHVDETNRQRRGLPSWREDL